jgi:hypothetical protein
MASPAFGVFGALGVGRLRSVIPNARSASDLRAPLSMRT